MIQREVTLKVWTDVCTRIIPTFKIIYHSIYFAVDDYILYTRVYDTEEVYIESIYFEAFIR